MGFWEFLETYSGAFIALLTGALVFTTIVYVVVSMKLLKQSKNAFLADMVLRVMEIYRKGGKIEAVTDWIAGYRKAFMKIDKKLGIDLSSLLAVSLGTTGRAVQKKAEELEEKEEKLKKKIKKAKELERLKNREKKKL